MLAQLVECGSRWRLGAAIAAVVAGGALATPTAWATVDAPVRSGPVVVTNSIIRTETLTHGNGATEFSLRLPDGAVCPGDSANDQWRLQSFMIPAADDPTTIRYGSIGPEPQTVGRSSLFMLDTRPFVHQLTRRNTGKGEPGVISVLPGFSLAVQASEAIPTGEYRIGIACTNFGKTAVYWDTEIAVTVSPDGKAAGLEWRLASVSPDVIASETASRNWVTPVVFGGLAALLIAMLLWKRRSRQATTERASASASTRTIHQTTTLSKESQ